MTTRFKTLEVSIRATGRDWHSLTAAEVAGLWEATALVTHEGT
jgi:hypothetical protein